MSEPVPLANLVADLRAAAYEGWSGAYFITTEDQHSAMITLDDGTITGLKYRSVRGHDAARALAESARVRYSSAVEPTALPGEEPLDTRAVLETLAGTATPPAPAAASEDDTPAPPIDLEALRSRYIAAIGPIAGALFDEAVDELGGAVDTQEGIDRLIRRLADQIDDGQEAERFLRDARRRH